MRHYVTTRVGKTVHIEIANNDEEYLAEEKRLDKKLGFKKYKSKSSCLGYICGKQRWFLYRDLDLDTIGHEVYHLVLSLDYKDEEAAARLSGALVEWMAKDIAAIGGKE